MNEDDVNRNVTILYGTQTGTAQEVAERIGREAKRRWFKTRIYSLDHYDWTQLPTEKVVIFAVATTGQGEVPDNMKKFWKFLLQKRLPSDSLSATHFAVFGLGDSSYPQFNFVGKRLYRRLLNLGGHSILRRGDGDDQHPLGLEGEIDPWLTELWNILLSDKYYPLPSTKQIQPANILAPSRYRVIARTSDISHPIHAKSLPTSSSPHNQQHPFYAKVSENKRLTSSDWEQDVRLISFDLEDSGLSYSPGDVAYILPKNQRADALEFITYMGYDPSIVIEQFVPQDEDVLPMNDVTFPITLLDFVQNYLDFMGTMRRYFFELRSFFATEPHEKERLEYFASTEGQEDLRFYNHKERRTAFQVFLDFPSAKPPFEYLIDMIPRIQPRAFSISSSLKAHPQHLQLTMAVVQFKTPMGRIRKGVCSTWLASLNPNDSSTPRVPLWIKPGFIRLPTSPQVPVIMVGPGTGLAIFRSFIEERRWQKSQGMEIGSTAFFFGCRLEEKDYLHGDEWKVYQAEGTLSLYEVAFSRNKEENDKVNRAKTYVQHKIKERSSDVWQLIQAGAYIYVSGSANRMPIDVKEAFTEVISKEGNISLKEAEEQIKLLEKSNRYQVETWT